MFQPATGEIASEAPQPERETVIKFVISGPYLNAETAHTQWPAEPPPTTAMLELVRRIAELERKLDEERALVEILSRQMPSPAAPAPAPEHDVTPPPADDHPALAEPAPACEVATVAEPAARSIAAPPPPPLSTATRLPPPKVRGLRRMIGALRHL